jgi:plasmid stability protein
MPTLHVRSVPEEIYEELQEKARESNRSLSAEVVTLLAQALEHSRARSEHYKALDSIQRRRFKLGKGAPRTRDLLKEDRRR